MSGSNLISGGHCPELSNCKDRREIDAAYRATVLTKMEGYDVALPRIESNLEKLSTITQENFNRIYFRIGAVSGGAGLVSGIVGTLVTLHLNK